MAAGAVTRLPVHARFAMVIGIIQASVHVWPDQEKTVTVRLFISIALLLGAASPVARADKEKSPQGPAKSPPQIYDEKADGEGAIRSAVATAKQDHRHVLIQWGANWCPWCHRLYHQFRANPDVGAALAGGYHLVLVDVGRRDKNMELATRYGVHLDKVGIPFLTVLDMGGKTVVNQPTEPFEKPAKEEKGYDSPKIVEFLKKYQPVRQ
jgi:thiol:disulfide interchange protein